MGKNKKASPLESVQKEKYVQAFFISFIAFALVILPLVIYTKGYFIYYGDYNSQQMPFYYHAHEMVSNGNFFWDWGTDLGSNFMGSYSFYLFFSPFFWITMLLKQKFVIYAMPVLLCLKYALASLTAYAYIRKFVKNTDCALIGSLLYAFSGFQAYNVFFNHFHDVTAFFPLLLCALEDRINKNRRGVFIIAVAFMAMLNYFFFTGQVVFVMIYLVVRCSSSDFKISSKKYIAIIIEAILGVMVACFALLPSAMAVMDNSRVSEMLYGMDMVAYSDRTKIWRIIQSFFMIPDAPARPNLFRSDNSKWASIAGYLPLFSMAGVIAFMNKKRSHWATKLTVVCIICAFIPILNSMFYMFNASYYARWFYMPVLIMAMMTANTLEDPETDMKGGLKVCGGFIAAFGIISLLPVKKDGEIKWFSFPANPAYFYITLAVSALCLIYACHISSLKSEKKPYIKNSLIATITACFVSTATIVYFGVSIGPYPNEYLKAGINAEEFDLSPIEDEIIEETEGIEEIAEEINQNDNDFFRVDVSENYDNFPMFWGYSSMRTFHSIVPSSIMNFYDEIGITRDVASRADTSSYTLRGLFSVKYYFSWNNRVDGSTESEINGFEYLRSQNGFDIYENKYYIPMGFTYDTYIPLSKAEEIKESEKEKVLIKSIIVDDEYMIEHEDDLALEYNDKAGITEEQYYEECVNRKESSCYSFEYDTNGFTAKTNLENSNLVFFSVPYDKGWTATVNGIETEIVKANFGFMAVKGETGENIIKFTYRPYGLDIGIIISIAGVVLSLIYMIVSAVSAGKPKKSAKNKKASSSKGKKKSSSEEKTEKPVEEIEYTQHENDDINESDEIDTFNEFEEDEQTEIPQQNDISQENQEEIERFMKGYTSITSTRKTAEDFRNSKLFEDISNDLREEEEKQRESYNENEDNNGEEF